MLQHREANIAALELELARADADQKHLLAILCEETARKKSIQQHTERQLRHIEALELQLSASIARMQKLEAQVKALELQLSALVARHAKMKEEIAALSSASVARQEGLTALLERLTALQERLTALNSAWVARQAEMDERIAALQSASVARKAELAQLTALHSA